MSNVSPRIHTLNGSHINMVQNGSVLYMYYHGYIQGWITHYCGSEWEWVTCYHVSHGRELHTTNSRDVILCGWLVSK